MPEDKQIQELIRGFENLATEWAFAKYIGNKKNTAFNAWRDLIEYFRKALKAQEKATEQRCVKEIEKARKELLGIDVYAGITKGDVRWSIDKVIQSITNKK